MWMLDVPLMDGKVVEESQRALMAVTVGTGRGIAPVLYFRLGQ